MSSVCLITGANGGVGSALAQSLLESGRRDLVFHYRTASDSISAILRKFDIDPDKHLFQANLSNETEVALLQKKIAEKHGFVEGLINIAGASSNSMSWKTSLEGFRKVIDDNLTTTFLVCREFSAAMRINQKGSIINISSIVASTGVAGASPYCAAKAGIEGFSRALALELAPKNIRVNTLALGYFEYGLINDVPPNLQERIKESIPLKRFGTGKDIAGIVDYLTSDKCPFMTGQTLHLNGGQLFS